MSSTSSLFRAKQWSLKLRKTAPQATNGTLQILSKTLRWCSLSRRSTSPATQTTWLERLVCAVLSLSACKSALQSSEWHTHEIGNGLASSQPSEMGSKRRILTSSNTLSTSIVRVNQSHPPKLTKRGKLRRKITRRKKRHQMNKRSKNKESQIQVCIIQIWKYQQKRLKNASRRWWIKTGGKSTRCRTTLAGQKVRKTNYDIRFTANILYKSIHITN